MPVVKKPKLCIKSVDIIGVIKPAPGTPLAVLSSVISHLGAEGASGFVSALKNYQVMALNNYIPRSGLR